MKPPYRDPLIVRAPNKIAQLLRGTPPGLLLHRALHRRDPSFVCPVCDYSGPFVTARSPVYGDRKFAMCPSCGAAERHRLQALVFRELCKQRAPGQLRCLHCGPEPWFRGRLASQVGHYVSSDPVISRVHLRADLRRLPFSAGAFDIVIASFIIQYIPEDAVALTEIRRVLAPGGVALLAVPIVAATTIEYPGANTFESGGHVRAPGLDYFERYKAVFSLVRVYESADFPDAHQLYVYEDRTNWPNEWMPLRKPMPGERHPEFLPVCFA